MLLLISYLAVVKHGNKEIIVIIILGLAFVASGRFTTALCSVLVLVKSVQRAGSRACYKICNNAFMGNNNSYDVVGLVFQGFIFIV
jgi:hypothetical protein